jgi:hypothetical protein
MGLTVTLGVGVTVFTVLIFSTSEVYFANAFAFPFVARDFLPIGLLVAAIMTLLGSSMLWAILTRIPASIQERLVALVVSIGFALFLQGTYIGWNFGPLDGHAIKWEEHRLHLWDLLLWAVVIAIPQIVSGLRSMNTLRGICIVLLITQVSIITISVVTTNEFETLKRYEADVSNRFVFSRERNIVLVVLDEFQCDIFEDLLREKPSLSESFEGFTFFKNAVAPAKQTFPSIPAMLTGIRYDNSISVPAYLERSYLNNSLFKKLTDNDVKVEVFPMTPGTVLLSPEVASNAVMRHHAPIEFLPLIDIGLVRSVPFILKPWVHRDGNGLTSNIVFRLKTARRGKKSTSTLPPADMRSFRDGLAGATAQADGTVFKFDHMYGMHVPLKFDENLRHVRGATYNRNNYRRQALGVIGVMQSFVKKLRELNVYDRSLVIIMGDHGSGRAKDLWIQPSNPDDVAFNKIKARACPLLLVKPFQSAEGSRPRRLTMSSAPVALMDIPPTIFAALGINEGRRTGEGSNAGYKEQLTTSFRRRPLFSVSENGARLRRYDSYTWERFKPNYLSPITEYIVDGDVWNDGNWRKGRIFYPPQ